MIRVGLNEAGIMPVSRSKVVTRHKGRGEDQSAIANLCSCLLQIHFDSQRLYLSTVL